MSFQGHYIGYADLEKMLGATSHCGDVHANCIFESSSAQLAQMGMDSCSTIIQVSRIDGEIVHYWRWNIATVLLLASGEPFDSEKSRRAHIAGDSAWSAVLSWLNTKTRVIESASSMPKNMNHLSGEQPVFLEYQSETAQYHLREGTHA